MSSSPSAASGAAFDFEQLAPPPRREKPPSMSEAAARARSVVAAAEAEAGRIREEAARQGYGEGFEAARAEAQTQLEPVLSALSEAVAGLREHQARVADSLEAQAASLAVDIAEKVIAGALDVEPERVLDVVRGALRAIVERDRLVIQVHPDDLTLVQEGMDALAASLGGIEHVDVQEERRVSRGGAIIRTSVGVLDASISTKLDRAREAVQEQLGS